MSDERFVPEGLAVPDVLKAGEFPLAPAAVFSILSLHAQNREGQYCLSDFCCG
jgi:hypothetical protein